MFSYLASRLMLPMHISSTSQSRFQSCGSGLREAIAAKIPEKGELIKKLRQQYGKTVLGEVTLNQIYGGMRGLPALVCETSVLDPNEGIRFRGLSLPECQKKLPKLCESPLPEGIFWLMCTGDVPTMDQVKALSAEWADRSKLPKHVVKMLKNFPKTLHPMAQLSCAVTALSNDSCFVKAYNEGVKKTDFWQYCYEDVMDLLGKLPTVAAHIYMNTFKDGVDSACVDKDLDWSHNFCNMIDYESDEFVELMRLYLTIHADHEGGNVSAHAVKLVGSALSNPFLAYAAGMNGLAGPLHGLANQEVLLWLREVQKEVGKDPSEDKLKEIVNKTLKSGRVIPGYGHAVLRKTDPRYISQREFALKYLPDDEMFQLVSKMFAVVPPILTSLGKVQNPWPNVDAHSGVLLQYYGMKETSYYTVLFGVSRALGTMACQIWDRAMLLPIERPKSFSTEALIKMICEKKKGKGEGKDKDKGKDQPKKNAKEQDKAKDKCKSEPKKEAKKQDKAKDKCKSDPKKKAKEQDKAKDKCKSDPKKKAKEQDKAKAEDKCKTEPKEKSKEQKKATAKDHCKSETKKKDKDQAKDKCKTEPKKTAKEQKKATAKDHCKSQTKKKDKDQAKDLCKGQEKKQGKDKRKGKAKCNSNGKDKAKSKPKCNGKNKKKGQDLCNQDKGNTGPKCNGKGQGKKKK